MVQILEQEDIGESLGKSLGSGLGKGANQLLTLKLNQMLSQQKQAQQAALAQSKPFTIFDVKSNLGKLGLDKNQLDLLEPQDFEEISLRANELIPTHGRDKAFVMAIEEKFNPHTAGSGMPSGVQSLQNEDMKEEEGLWDVLKKGSESSIASRQASILRGEGEEAFQKRTQLKKGGMFRNLLYSLAKLGWDSPYYAAGGTAGAAAGGALGAAVGGPFGAAAGATIGGGAGSLALPAMVETGLQEYQKYLDRGGKGSFGDFIDSAAKTLESGIYGAAEGALLGTLSKLKVLSKVPRVKKLLKLRGGKAAEKLLDTGIQAGIFTGAQGLAEQRIPSLDEYGQNLGMFLGLDLFHKAGKYSKNIYSQLKKAGIPPKEAAVRIQEKVQEKGYDLNNRNDVVRVIKDITKEGSRAGEVARETIAETETPSEPPKETAKKLAERPIEEYIEREKEAQKKKEKPLTEREKAKRESAASEIPEVERRIERVQDDVSYLRERMDKKLSKDQRGLAEIALRQKEAELKNLRKQREDLKGISEKGVKPFREEDLTKAIDEHIKKIEKAATATESPEAKDLKRMFDRDQKYIHRFMELGEKGKLPPAPYKDRFIKILESYQKAYESTLKKLENQAKELPKGKDSAVQRNLDLMKRNYDINKAKIENQKDKLNSLYQLKKPGSAFVKQNLKDLRKDIKDLQKDFVKQSKLLNEAESKVKDIFKKEIQPYLTELRKASTSSLKNLSEASGIPVSELKSNRKTAQSLAKDFVEKIKKGEPLEGIPDKLSGLMKGKNKLGRAIVGALVFGQIKKFVKDEFDINIPYSLVAFLFPFTSGIRYGAALFGSLGEQIMKKYPIRQYRKKFENAKSFGETQKIYREMKEKGYSDKQIGAAIKGSKKSLIPAR